MHLSLSTELNHSGAGVLRDAQQHPLAGRPHILPRTAGVTRLRARCRVPWQVLRLPRSAHSPSIFGSALGSTWHCSVSLANVPPREVPLAPIRAADDRTRANGADSALARALKARAARVGFR